MVIRIITPEDFIMNIATGYLVKEILKGAFFALALLLTLVNLFSLTDELKDLGKGSYDLSHIFLYLALSTPTIFYTLVPSAALIGSIFVLGSMANHREIIALRASGLSIFWIIRTVLLAGVILIVISLIVGEWIAPQTERAAQLLKTTAQNNRVVMQAKYGIWLREGNSFINIRQIAEKSQLTDISFYYLNSQHHLNEVVHAQTGRFMEHDYWQLNDLQKTQLSPNRAITQHFETQTWRSSIVPDLVDIVVVTSANLSSIELNKYIKFLKKNNQKSQIFEAALWNRLLNPLVTLSMLLVSSPFMIGIKRDTSVGGRLVIGIILGLSFNIIDQIISHLGIVYQLNPLLMALLPSSLIWLGAGYGISRLR
jgi:lipopolysaccharide export system permease protein